MKSFLVPRVLKSSQGCHYPMVEPSIRMNLILFLQQRATTGHFGSRARGRGVARANDATRVIPCGSPVGLMLSCRVSVGASRFTGGRT